jgi:hypothetical protein
MKRVSVPSGGGPEAVAALKQNVDMLTGQHTNARPLRPLEPTATLAEVIAAVNVLIARSQGDQ